MSAVEPIDPWWEAERTALICAQDDLALSASLRRAADAIWSRGMAALGDPDGTREVPEMPRVALRLVRSPVTLGPAPWWDGGPAPVIGGTVSVEAFELSVCYLVEELAEGGGLAGVSVDEVMASMMGLARLSGIAETLAGQIILDALGYADTHKGD